MFVSQIFQNWRLSGKFYWKDTCQGNLSEITFLRIFNGSDVRSGNFTLIMFFMWIFLKWWSGKFQINYICQETLPGFTFVKIFHWNYVLQEYFKKNTFVREMSLKLCWPGKFYLNDVFQENFSPIKFFKEISFKWPFWRVFYWIYTD